MPRVKNEDGTEVEIDFASDRPSPERLALSAEAKEAMQRAIKSLTDMERTAFVMRHFEGCSSEEISVALNQSVTAAKNTVFRAVQKLRRALAPYVEEAAR
jgi:RNA polymerase sigma-70 factor (ECF subfamily)